jgi:hypothetical protein
MRDDTDAAAIARYMNANHGMRAESRGEASRLPRRGRGAARVSFATLARRLLRFPQAPSSSADF